MADEKTSAGKKAVKKTGKKEKKKSGFTYWLGDMRGEMKKIVWPTKETTAKNTGIVIGMCAVVGAFLWVFDAVAVTVVQTLIDVLR